MSQHGLLFCRRRFFFVLFRQAPLPGPPVCAATSNGVGYYCTSPRQGGSGAKKPPVGLSLPVQQSGPRNSAKRRGRASPSFIEEISARRTFSGVSHGKVEIMRN